MTALPGHINGRVKTKKLFSSESESEQIRHDIEDGDEFGRGEVAVVVEGDVGIIAGGTVVDLAVTDGADDVAVVATGAAVYLAVPDCHQDVRVITRRAGIHFPVPDGQEDIRIVG